MPKAKSQENKENATAQKADKKEAYKLEEGKDDDDSGDDSSESEEEETKGTDKPVSIP